MKIKRLFGAVAILALFTVALSRIMMLSVSAAPNDVVINELAYNPGTGNSAHEFIELRNNTGSQIDLEGWCFTSGVSLCFEAGHTIDANDYVIVSPSFSASISAYGEASLDIYTGSLSNSGETVTLRDNTSTIVNTVTYSDSRPWPITPDGTGPTLELNDPYGDTTDPENWGAALPNDITPEITYTPNAENTIYDSGVPIIRSVTDPNDIAPSASVNINADVEGAGITVVNLIYQIGFDFEAAPVEMVDDGAHNDGAAADGEYGASIPGQPAGTLVRFRIEATNAGGTTESPRYDDSQNYHGYYIAQSVSTNAEELEWFMSDADYADMHTNHVEDDVYLPTVFAYGDEVYDNSEVRIKGEYSRTFPKKSYKFKLPKNYKVTFNWDNNDSSLPIDEFHLNSDYSSESIARVPSAWWAADIIGMPTPDLAVSRLQKNGEFEGLYILIDKYEDEWRNENGFDNGALYEDYTEIVDGADDLSLIDDWRSAMLTDRRDLTRRDKVLDQNNIPAIISYMTTRAVVRNHDTSMTTNTFSYLDDDTGRWEFLLWDMDLLLQDSNKSVTPYDIPYFFNGNSTFATQAVYDQPDLQAAFYRRLRTMVDQFFSDNQYLEHFQAVNDLHADDIDADVAKWPNADGFIRTPAQADERDIEDLFYDFYSFHKTPWGGGLPASQTSSERAQVQIAEVVSHATNSNEYIRLSNSASTAVDISNWYVEGINYELPAGSVIPAGGSMYLLRDDVGYRASHAPVLVAGQYATDLSAVGGTILRLNTDQDVEIDSYDY
jgi:hypothetical protein